MYITVYISFYIYIFFFDLSIFSVAKVLKETLPSRVVGGLPAGLYLHRLRLVLTRVITGVSGALFMRQVGRCEADGDAECTSRASGPV